MLSIFIGFLSALILVNLFSKLEKNRVKQLGNAKYLIVLLVCFSAFLVSPVNNIKEWIIWLGFFYTVLDDLETKTVFTPIYIGIYVFVLFDNKGIEEFLFSIILFVIFFIFSKKTKETFFSIGDCYAILALSLWLEGYVIVAIILAMFLASIFLPIAQIIQKENYYAFTPYLIMASVITKEKWYIYEVFFTSFSLNLVFILVAIYVRNKGNKKKKMKKRIR